MNYYEQITVLNSNNIEYKCVRLQKYNDYSHRATNKYYVNGKLVSHQERFICMSLIDNSTDYTFTERKWIK